jgi:hypothetical protein
MAGGRSGRPRHWNDERIAEELRAFAVELGHRPTNSDFPAHGRQPLLSAMLRRGGRERFYEALSDLPEAPDRQRRYGPLPGPRPDRRRWTPKTIHAELRAYAAGMEHFPTAAQMEADGRGDLRRAIRNYGGTKHWAEKVGLSLRPGQDRAPYDTDDAVADARRLVAERGELPGMDKIRALGYPRLASFIHWRCGSSTSRFIAEHLS